MKKLIIFVLLLTGCSHTTVVTHDDIEDQKAFCYTHRGLYNLVYSRRGLESFSCNDGFQYLREYDTFVVRCTKPECMKSFQ